MKTRTTILTLAATAVLAAAGYFGLVSPNATDRPNQRFSTMDDLFRVQLNQGWKALSLPDDGKAYAACGFAYSSPELSGKTWTPKFSTADGTIECPVKIPDGKVVSVVCLLPADNGPVCYGVLTRNLAGHEIATAEHGG